MAEFEGKTLEEESNEDTYEINRCIALYLELG